MDLKKCISNLKHDMNNGGLEEDTFASICYMTMANKAQNILKSNSTDQQSADRAREYLAMCCNAGLDSLKRVAGI